MKTAELSAKKRTETGKRSTKELRAEGKVPAALYNKGEAEHIVLDYKESSKVVFTSDTYIVNLDIEGEAKSAVVRDVQYHPVKDTIEHIEFMQVGDEPVTLVLPIRLTGTPKGVTKGGKLIQTLRKLKVKGIPSKLPEMVEVDVSSLELGMTKKVSEADFGDLQVITAPTAGVASIEIPRSLRSAQQKAQAGEEASGTATE